MGGYMTLEKEANKLLYILEQAGFSSYKVGGYVRDKLLDLPVKDIDIATSARPEQVTELFPKVIPTGIKHGTVTVHWQGESFEVTTFRKESEYSDHRHPDQVHFVNHITIDLGRRDFTINAMAMDQSGTIIDPFGGQTDLRNKVIRAVGEPLRRFTEDPLRILRGIRFSANLGFGIHPHTWRAMSECGYLLHEISKERIRDEWSKIIEGSHAIVGLEYLSYEGLVPLLPWATIFSAYNRHPNKHQLHRWKNPAYRWAFLLSTSNVTETMDISQLLLDWKFPKRLIRQIEALLFIKDQPIITPIDGKRLLIAHGLDIVKQGSYIRAKTLPDSLCVDSKLLTQWDHELVIGQPKDLAIQGRDLLNHFALQPGPWVSQMLSYLFEQVAFGHIPNDQASLLQEARKVHDDERTNFKDF
jgi:tRNA nucleotidyltransferase (CCA-adding enzyme)